MNKSSDSNRAIRTELPGPKARAVLARDAEVVSPSYPREHPFVMSRWVVDAYRCDGRRYIVESDELLTAFLLEATLL